MTHLKRLVASKHFPIPRKTRTFTISPSPGPHPKTDCIPLGIILKNILKFAETSKEAKKILSSGEILVDGRQRRSHKYPVGVMDIIEMPKIKKYFRVVAKEGKLKLVETDAAKAKMKVCKINNKTIVKKGKIQLNLHDGRNILTDNKDYKAGDTVMISIPDQKIEGHFKLEKGALVLITGGKYVGTVGKIVDLITMRGIETNKAVVESEGTQYRTLKDYVFVIGKDKPAIALE